MKIKIQKRDIMKPIEAAVRAAQAKSSLPILTNVVLRARDGKLHIAATDLYVSVQSSVACEVSEDGELCVNAKSFRDVVKSMPSGDLTIATKGNALELKGGKAKFKLPGMPAGDFPALPATEKPLIPSERGAVLRAIMATFPAINPDDSRLDQHSLFFRCVDGRLTCAATDGKRLMVASAATNFPATALVPLRGVGEIKALCEGASGLAFAVDGGQLFIQSDDALMSVKLTDGGFLPFEKVVPTSTPHMATFVRADMIDAVKRVSLVANREGNISIRFCGDGLFLSAESSESGEATESLSADYHGEDVTATFCARYWLDAMAVIVEDEAVIEHEGTTTGRFVSHGVANRDEFTVTMPIRPK